MRNDWRIGVALGLAVLVGATAARAQVAGPGDGGQTGGSAAVPQAERQTNGGLSDPGQGNPALKEPGEKPVVPPRPKRVSSFNRVTTARRDAVSAPSSAGPVRAQEGTAKDRIPKGSSWQQGTQQPTTPPAATVRSSSHNYYPGMRISQHPNANTPQAARTGQRRTGMQAGALSGAGLSTAKSARSPQTAAPAAGRPATGAPPRR
jgi:hypothetical protein